MRLASITNVDLGGSWMTLNEMEHSRGKTKRGRCRVDYIPPLGQWYLGGWVALINFVGSRV